MNEASSLARKLTVPTRSSGVSSRGMARHASDLAPAFFVLRDVLRKLKAGATVHRDAPATSRARPRVIAITAPCSE